MMVATRPKVSFLPDGSISPEIMDDCKYNSVQAVKSVHNSAKMNHFSSNERSTHQCHKTDYM
jgi:hypothetical protein